MFHVNLYSGEVNKCRAKVQCPFDSLENHFDTKEQAIKASEDYLDALFSSDKTVLFPFVSDQEIKDFTRGDCDTLALEFSEQLSLPLYSVYYNGVTKEGREYTIGAHLGVLLEDGRVLDAKGIWTKEDFLKEWENKISTDEGLEASIVNKKRMKELNFKEFTTFPTSNPKETSRKILEKIPIKTLTTKKKNKILLTAGFSKGRVVNGDLSDFKARELLSKGLCGNLALEIHNITGNDLYLVFEDKLSAKRFEKEGDKDKSLIYDAFHAITKDQNGEYVDSFGYASEEKIKDYFGEEATLIKTSAQQIKRYSSKNKVDLSLFALSAIELAENKISYNY